MWMAGRDAVDAVMMQVNGIGAFVRALLPVQLTGGYTVTYGIWVGITPEELRHIYDVWWEPEYRHLHVDGVIANIIEPWGLYRTPVTLRVLDQDHTPYCVSSTDSVVEAVLHTEWDHHKVLSTLPH